VNGKIRAHNPEFFNILARAASPKVATAEQTDSGGSNSRSNFG
jgi:hypothetical protein